jgi:tripartite ATP-independent transporter DctM subunit
MIICALIILIVFLILGVPVPMAFFASTLFICILGGYDPGFLLPFGYSKISTVVLLSIPLFILAGNIMEKGRIGDKLVDVIDLCVGRIRGGLGAVAVISSAIFGSITGSSMATLSCIGGILFPQLRHNGFPLGHSAALMANSAVLGILIPPSSLMILYSWAAGQSVLACFLSTVFPGVTLVLLFVIINRVLLRNCQTLVLSEKLTPPELRRQFVVRTKRALPAIFMPFLVLGGIYGGLFTPTEAAGVSVIYAIPIGFFVYKALDWTAFKEATLNAGMTTGLVMFMLYSVMILSRLYVSEDLPGTILNYMKVVTDSKYGILILMNVFMIIIGMLMDDVSAVMLCTPILVPIAKQIGIDPIHFAAIMSVNLGMGNITPPCAPLLYFSCSLNGASINDSLKTTFMLIIFGWIPCLIITSAIPDMALYLPRVLLGR